MIELLLVLFILLLALPVLRFLLLLLFVLLVHFVNVFQVLGRTVHPYKMSGPCIEELLNLATILFDVSLEGVLQRDALAIAVLVLRLRRLNVQEKDHLFENVRLELPAMPL